ncbi:MAG: hypothetical protein CSA05_00615 [Bacteroidia bacterium]|nr:MAG: hypothetical protein CSB01_01895 [Bacteroidia bacterium]PIE86455.1 MAG: hypothetical protein CSA05_00615 [Bacteroidia bacterium]
MKTLRKWNRIIHRDLGYFFFGMILIYSLSGIALNHIKDWNPSYKIENTYFTAQLPKAKEDISKQEVLALLAKHHKKTAYKKHYFPNNQTLKIFLKNGSISVALKSGEAHMEILNKRFLFNEISYLHYNPQKWWTWFSDIFAVALIVLAVSGLFIIRGKKGITGHGAWLTIAGFILPILFLILYK